jgi:hypothetical protein
MARSVYVITDLDGGDCRTYEQESAAMHEWDLMVSIDRAWNMSFIRVDLGRKPKIWTLGLKVGGYLVSSGGPATKKVPGGACQLPRYLRGI